MKKYFLLFTAIFFSLILQAQNVGIGIQEPYNKLQVAGNLMVSEPLISSNTAPTVSQMKTMINGSTIPFSPSDSVMRFYDPGGPAGNYLANLSGYIQAAYPGSVIAHEVTFESMDLGTGDSLIISESSGFGSTILMAVGNGYSTTGKWIFSTTNSTIYFQFKSNSDASLGAGFSVLVRRLYSTPLTLPAVANYFGKALFFDTKNGSLRSGLISDEVRGTYSVAFGQLSVASGAYSLAAGSQSVASGANSVAIGENCSATGTRSVAMGSAISSANYSVALGNGNASGSHSLSVGFMSTASGASSVAMGSNSYASGGHSLALGNDAQAFGEYAVAIGASAHANGDYCFVAGKDSRTSATHGVAIGLGITSQGFSGTAVGMYNYYELFGGQTSPTASTPLFVVGNGDDADNRSNAMIVRKDGRVGIGANLPVTRLQIGGGTDANLTDNSGYIVIGGVNDLNIVIDNNEIIARDNRGNTTLHLQATGGPLEIGGTAAKPGGGSWLATSDARLKQNITPYNDGLHELLKINPVLFQYNQLSGYDTEMQYVGVLAQELRDVAPYMVSTFQKDNTEYLKVDNGAMTYMLINAVKELSRQNEVLKERLRRLEYMSK